MIMFLSLKSSQYFIGKISVVDKLIHIEGTELFVDEDARDGFKFKRTKCPLREVISICVTRGRTGLCCQLRKGNRMIDANEKDFNQLHQIGEGLYSYVTEFRFDGKVPIQNRSILIHFQRGSDRGDIIVINPAALQPELVQQIRDLCLKLKADIRLLLSPGDWHYLFIGDHLKTFPTAKAFLPPGRIPSKEPQFSFEIFRHQKQGTLAPYESVLECALVAGLKDFPTEDNPLSVVPRYEYVFFHKPTQCLIAGDVVWYERFQLRPHQKALGIPLNTLTFHFGKWQIVGDIEAVKSSFAQIANWPFHHLISIHGDPGNFLVDVAHKQWDQVLDWAKS
jgi:hypothetical protein